MNSKACHQSKRPLLKGPHQNQAIAQKLGILSEEVTELLVSHNHLLFAATCCLQPLVANWLLEVFFKGWYIMY